MEQGTTHMVKIDYKKLLKEDKDFMDFCAEAYMKITLELNPDLIKGMYAFYQMGMTADQVAKFMKESLRVDD